MAEASTSQESKALSIVLQQAEQSINAQPAEKTDDDLSRLQAENIKLRGQLTRIQLHDDLLASQIHSLEQELAIARQQQVQATAFIAHNSTLVDEARTRAERFDYLSLSHDGKQPGTSERTTAPLQATLASSRMLRPVTPGAGVAARSTATAEVRRLMRELEMEKRNAQLREEALLSDIDAARNETREARERVTELRRQEQAMRREFKEQIDMAVREKDEEIRRLKEEIHELVRSAEQREDDIREQWRFQVQDLTAQISQLENICSRASESRTRAQLSATNPLSPLAASRISTIPTQMSDENLQSEIQRLRLREEQLTERLMAQIECTAQLEAVMAEKSITSPQAPNGAVSMKSPSVSATATDQFDDFVQRQFRNADNDSICAPYQVVKWGADIKYTGFICFFALHGLRSFDPPVIETSLLFLYLDSNALRSIGIQQRQSFRTWELSSLNLPAGRMVRLIHAIQIISNEVTGFLPALRRGEGHFAPILIMTTRTEWPPQMTAYLDMCVEGNVLPHDAAISFLDPLSEGVLDLSRVLTDTDDFSQQNLPLQLWRPLSRILSRFSVDSPTNDGNAGGTVLLRTLILDNNTVFNFRQLSGLREFILTAAHSLLVISAQGTEGIVPVLLPALRELAGVHRTVLRRVLFSSSDVDDITAIHLPQSVRELSLDSNCFRPSLTAGGYSLQSTFSPVLNRLSVANNYLPKAFLEAMARSLPPSLTELDLSGCGITGSVLSAFAEILAEHWASSGSALRVLLLDGNDGLDPLFVRAVARIVPVTPQLQQLDIGSQKPTESPASSDELRSAFNELFLTLARGARKLNFIGLQDWPVPQSAVDSLDGLASSGVELRRLLSREEAGLNTSTGPQAVSSSRLSLSSLSDLEDDEEVAPALRPEDLEASEALPRAPADLSTLQRLVEKQQQLISGMQRSIAALEKRLQDQEALERRVSELERQQREGAGQRQELMRHLISSLGPGSV